MPFPNSGLDILQQWVGVMPTPNCGRSQSDTEQDQVALPKAKYRPRVEIPHTDQKLTSKTF